MGLFCTSMCSAHVLHGSSTFYIVVLKHFIFNGVTQPTTRIKYYWNIYRTKCWVFIFSFFGGIKSPTTQIVFNAGSTNEFTNRKSPKYTMTTTTTTTMRPSLSGSLPPHPSFSLSMYVYVLNRITFILRFFPPKIKGQRRWLCVHV